jgi:hypothetical protein
MRSSSTLVCVRVASDTLLVGRARLGGDFPIGDLVKAVAGFRLVEPQIRLDLARSQLSNMEDKAQRVVDLLAVMLEDQPSGRAAAYLQRVARCYIEGLDPECLVMCRAVLDSVFEEAVSTADVKGILPSERIGGSVQLAHRIEAAERLGRINKSVLLPNPRMRRRASAPFSPSSRGVPLIYRERTHRIAPTYRVQRATYTRNSE